MAQPPNDAQYTPATQDRSHAEAGTYNPVEKITVGGVEFTLYDEPVDQANFIAFMVDAIGKRQGVSRMDGKPMDSQDDLSFVGHYGTREVDGIVRHMIGISVLN